MTILIGGTARVAQPRTVRRPWTWFLPRAAAVARAVAVGRVDQRVRAKAGKRMATR